VDTFNHPSVRNCEVSEFHHDSSQLAAPPQRDVVDVVDGVDIDADVDTVAAASPSQAPSANMHANARALARLAAVMAGDGSAHGVTLLSPATVEASHFVTPGDVKHDTILNAKTKVNRGGWNVFDNHNFAHYRHGMVGWFGIGGSVLQWQRWADMTMPQLTQC
jgi:hypothetical protein